jgi:signal transduction histidine kinase
MDADELRNIFQKFYRTQRAQESGESGTGLGLAIVEEIVVQHGGSIEVESRLNQGSRFTLSLPAATGERGSDVSES